MNQLSKLHYTVSSLLVLTAALLILPGGSALALLMFNVGVEIGQLLFIAAILVVIFALRKLRHEWPAWMRQVPAYGIGGIAAFWLIERIMIF